MKGEAMYDNKQLCSECGGKCCKGASGGASPEDIERIFNDNLMNSLVSAFRSGEWVIDWWEGDPRGLSYDDPGAVCDGYYIRPVMSNDNKPGLYQPSWGGVCIFHNQADGCKLEPSNRPLTCRLLEPQPDNKCVMHDGGSKREVAVMWVPFHNEITEAGKIACA